jgi:predicted amidohydrolase
LRAVDSPELVRHFPRIDETEPPYDTNVRRCVMRIAFLHLSPIPGDLSGNRECIRHGVIKAADKGARWVLTPELATCGYTFAESHGLDWIEPAPDPWSAEIGGIAAQRGVTVFLATPERDAETSILYNSLLVFDGAHGLVGSHRKVNPLRVGSEA